MVPPWTPYNRSSIPSLPLLKAPKMSQRWDSPEGGWGPSYRSPPGNRRKGPRDIWTAGQVWNAWCVFLPLSRSFFFFLLIGFLSCQRNKDSSRSTSPKPSFKCPACTSLTRALGFLFPPSQPGGSKRLLFICTFKSRLPPVTRSSQAPGCCKKSPPAPPPPSNSPFGRTGPGMGQGSPGVRVGSGRRAVRWEKKTRAANPFRTAPGPLTSTAGGHCGIKRDLENSSQALSLPAHPQDIQVSSCSPADRVLSSSPEKAGPR